MRTALLWVVACCFCCVVAGDPDTWRNFTQIVQSKGYPCESHHVITGDGYILTVFRIPHGRNGKRAASGPPVVLQHGLLDSSFSWILNEPGESLPYLLSDAGYDVWMSNNRGNRYSLQNVHYTPAQSQFWQFSWDQMALLDFPAIIDYVLQETGRSQLSYVGHSEGTTIAFAGLSVNTTLAQKLNIFIGFGPVASVSNVENLPLKDIADLYIDELYAWCGFNEFLPSSYITEVLFAEFCGECGLCCADVIEFICGPHQGAFNDSRMPVMATHEPGGTSTQNIEHWAQWLRDKTFQMYDYGSAAANIAHYGTPTPPSYDIANIHHDLSIALFSGGEDELADPDDVLWLVDTLRAQNRTIYWQDIPNYAHLDFLWAVDANKKMYPQVMTLLQKANYQM